MLPVETLLVLAFAAFRLTRVFTTDTLTANARARLYTFAWDDSLPVVVDGRAEPSPRAAWRTYLYEWATCAWCLGIWVTAAVYSAWRWWDVTPVRAVIVILAIAGVQGLVAGRLDK